MIQVELPCAVKSGGRVFVKLNAVSEQKRNVWRSGVSTLRQTMCSNWMPEGNTPWGNLDLNEISIRLGCQPCSPWFLHSFLNIHFSMLYTLCMSLPLLTAFFLKTFRSAPDIRIGFFAWPSHLVQDNIHDRLMKQLNGRGNLTIVTDKTRINRSLLFDQLIKLVGNKNSSFLTV